MIKNLIFDFGKVLVDYDYFLVLDQLFATHRQAEDFYHHLTDDQWTDRLDRESPSFEQVIADMQAAMPQYANEIQGFADRYPDFIFGEIKGMRALLGRLKAEGYKLYGLTNWCSKVHITMRQYPIFQLLDDRIISSEEHLIKPEVAIYERACQKLGLKPEECVFTDDKMVNIEAARQYGMKAICFHDAVQYESALRELIARQRP
ncbi:MAG: HAD family phosphatase [Prevotella sp.]|nr:HAD family phosphatase [Prevotella sp.]